MRLPPKPSPLKWAPQMSAGHERNSGNGLRMNGGLWRLFKDLLSQLGCPSIRKQGCSDSGYRDVADPRYQSCDFVPQSTNFRAQHQHNPGQQIGQKGAFDLSAVTHAMPLRPSLTIGSGIVSRLLKPVCSFLTLLLSRGIARFQMPGTGSGRTATGRGPVQLVVMLLNGGCDHEKPGPHFILAVNGGF
jgi:hypothetical protein